MSSKPKESSKVLQKRKTAVDKQKKHTKRRRKRPAKEAGGIHSYLPNKSLLEKIQRKFRVIRKKSTKTRLISCQCLYDRTDGNSSAKKQHKYVNQKRDIVRQNGDDKSGRSLPITVLETDKTNAVHDELLPTSNDCAILESKETELLYDLGYNVQYNY